MIAAVATPDRLLRGSFFRTAELFVALAATLFVTPLLVHSLGDRLFGFWTLAGAFVGYYGLLDFGLSSAAARYLAQALGRGDQRELDRVASTALFLFVAVAGVLGAATLAAALLCPLFLRDPAEAAVFQRLVVILGIAAAAGFPAKVYGGLLAADIRHDVVALISIARTLAFSGIVYSGLRAGGGIMTVAVASSVLSLLQSAAVYAAARARFPAARILPSGRDRATVGSMFRYGRTTVICQLGEVLRLRKDSFVIAGCLSASLITPYAIGVRLAEGFGHLVLGCVGMMTPVFSRYDGRGDYDSMRRALLKVTKLSAIASAFAGGSILFYAPAFVGRWLGPGFDAAVGVAMLLTLGLIIALPQSPGVQLLYGVSKHHLYARLSLAEGALNLALSLLLLRHYGLYGVALGTTVSMVAFKLFVQPFFICRAAGLGVREYLVDAILLTLLKAAAPLALYFWLIGRLVSPDYLALASCVGMQTLLFAPLAYWFILDAEERRVLAGAIQAVAAA